MKNETRLTDVVFSPNSVSGKISLDKPKLLFLSIPYEAGWKAYIDGEPVKLLQANVMYMALEVKEGLHTVELHYATPFAKVGLVISLLSLALIVVFFLRSLLIQK